MSSLIDEYSDKEFSKIVETSSSLTEVAKRIGYNAKSGDLFVLIKQRIQKLQLSTEHF